MSKSNNASSGLKGLLREIAVYWTTLARRSGHGGSERLSLRHRRFGPPAGPPSCALAVRIRRKRWRNQAPDGSENCLQDIASHCRAEPERASEVSLAGANRTLGRYTAISRRNLSIPVLCPKDKFFPWIYFLNALSLAPLFWGLVFGALGCAQKEVIPPSYEAGEDITEGRLEANYETIWEAVKTVLGDRGELIEENSVMGKAEADIDQSHVVLWLSQLTRGEGQLRIRAYEKETWAPNRPLAEDIFQSIYKETRKIQYEKRP